MEVRSGQTNNIDSVLGFAEPDSEDLHLVTGSACIDAGTSNNASTEDYDGNPRPQGAGYDIGAYEFEPVRMNERSAETHFTGDITLRPNPVSGGLWIHRSYSATLGFLRIFDITGRMVCALEFATQQSEIFWDRTDDSEVLLPAGNYFLIYTTKSNLFAYVKSSF